MRPLHLFWGDFDWVIHGAFCGLKCTKISTKIMYKGCTRHGEENSPKSLLVLLRSLQVHPGWRPKRLSSLVVVVRNAHYVYKTPSCEILAAHKQGKKINIVTMTLMWRCADASTHHLGGVECRSHTGCARSCVMTKASLMRSSGAMLRPSRSHLINFSS